MQVTATKFRKDLFKLLDQARRGESVEVLYKGATVQLTVPGAHSKLSRARRQHALAVDPEAIVHIDKKLMANLEVQWRKEHDRL